MRYGDRLSCFLLGTFCWTGLAAAAGLGDVDHPWLCLEARGHTATVRALAFSDDSLNLYSAGLDKAICCWRRDEAAGAWRFEKKIRWPIHRGPGGQIFALAASRTDGLLAVAGYSASASERGAIFLVDPLDGSLKQRLIGHHQTVTSLCFSDDGQWLASVDLDGCALLWRRGLWQSKTLYETDAKTYAGSPELLGQIQAAAAARGDMLAIRPIVMAGNDRVIVPLCVGAAEGKLRWQLAELPCNEPGRFRMLPGDHGRQVTALAADRGGNVLAAGDLDGRLCLRQLGAAPTVRSLESTPPSTAAVSSLCFSPDGKTLLAGTLVTAAGSQLQTWDVASGQCVSVKTLTDHVHACAFRPDGRQWAYVGGANSEVFVEQAAAEPMRLEGLGRRILRVAFAKEKPWYRIAIGTRIEGPPEQEQIPLDESFLLEEPDGQAKQGVGPGPRPVEADWLHAQQSPGGQYDLQWRGGTLTVLSGGSPTASIPLTKDDAGNRLRYAWIADEQGRPFAVAVGTKRDYGIYVYRIAGQGVCPLLRHFRGHEDAVTSVAVSQDRRYLASASLDGTVRVWSLDRLAVGDSLQGRWGMNFTPQDQGLIASDALTTGPLFRQGMKAGDVLDAIAWGQPVQTCRQPAEMLAALQSLPTGQMVQFEYRRAGRAEPQFSLSPAWQAVATLLTTSDREWAFWTPEGYYQASNNGHKLFGWQVNRGTGVLPDFHGAEHFRETLEKSQIMGKLLDAGSLEDAFRLASVVPAAPPQIMLTLQIIARPQVRILSPKPHQVIDAAVVQMEAQVTLPANVRCAGIRTLANGAGGTVTLDRPAEEHVGPSGENVCLYRWDVPLTDDRENRLRVTARSDAGLDADDEIPVASRPAKKAVANLFILAAAVDKYADAYAQNLLFPVETTRTIGSVLSKQSADLYTHQGGSSRFLTNKQVTREQWGQALRATAASIAQRANPNDLLVVYLSGHGINGRDYAPATDAYYFMAYDVDLRRLEDKGDFSRCISLADLQPLGDVRCRKVLFLDTCHSGAAQRLLTKTIRGLQDLDLVTITASEGHESAGQRVFADALIDGLRGKARADAARRADAASATPLTVHELWNYVQEQVRLKTGDQQHPTISPKPSEVAAGIPLVKLVMAER